VPEFYCKSDLWEDGLGLVTVRGELDLHTSGRLRREIVALVERGASRLVLDLSDVSFIDSMALGVVVGAQRRVEGPMALVVTDPLVLRVFSVSRLDQALSLMSSREEALQRVMQAGASE
jgi:anti-sigma B factor antagonist